MAASPGGISMMTPSERLISVGSPQPSFAIGPIRNIPSCGGKMARRSLMMRGALATTSCGNMMLWMEFDWMPSISGWNSIVRFSPSKPADGQQREAKAQLNSRAEVGRQDDEQREAARAVGHFCGDEPDGGDRQEVRDLELQGARILAAGGIDVEVAAALHDARIYGETDAVRR